MAQLRVLPAARNTVMVLDDQSTGRAVHDDRKVRYAALDAGMAETIELAAPLHDIGKIGIP